LLQVIEPEEGHFAEILVGDIRPDGSISQPVKRVSVNDRDLTRALRQRVQPGDVLLSIRGRIGAAGIVPEHSGDSDTDEWLAGQSFAILRLRDSSPISSPALYRYLVSPVCTENLVRICLAEGIP
jgi:type I restriction enzyme M protein